MYPLIRLTQEGRLCYDPFRYGCSAWVGTTCAEQEVHYTSYAIQFKSRVLDLSGCLCSGAVPPERSDRRLLAF